MLFGKMFKKQQFAHLLTKLFLITRSVTDMLKVFLCHDSTAVTAERASCRILLVRNKEQRRRHITINKTKNRFSLQRTYNL